VDYGLTQNDVGNLINFIRSLNQKPAAAPPNDKAPKLTSQLMPQLGQKKLNQAQPSQK